MHSRLSGAGATDQTAAPDAVAPDYDSGGGGGAAGSALRGEHVPRGGAVPAPAVAAGVAVPEVPLTGAGAQAVALAALSAGGLRRLEFTEGADGSISLTVVMGEPGPGSQ